MTLQASIKLSNAETVQAEKLSKYIQIDLASENETTQNALAGLSVNDRVLFQRFGVGPVAEPSHRSIHGAIEAQVKTAPKSIAARHLGSRITYGALNRQANHLAAKMAEQGVGPGDAVCLFLRRSIPMLIGILASLKLGACYVPQDVAVAPDEQLRHIAKAVKAKVILTLECFEDQMPRLAGVTTIAIEAAVREPRSLQPPSVEVLPDDRCFILFTSGTTGTPNGVQVTHRNLCNILLTEPGSLGIKPGTKVAHILSIAFDMAAWEILGCLSHGGTLVIRGTDIEEAVRQADVVIATPSVLGKCVAENCRNVKTVAVAGEPCPRPLADSWAAFATFYNSCGPTETTIVNTMLPHSPEAARLTIGVPTPNNTVYILDEDLRPLPIGEVGEMWAGGDCVTAGYLDNPLLTAERYLADPFLGGGRMMFRTRDLGRWTPEGALEHFGRTDDQVKIRGFRVELDSVSNALEKTEDCLQAVTLKLDDRNLAAFVRPASVNSAGARAQIEKALPYYCMPSVLLALEAFPMTSRGKIDKRKLLSIAKSETQPDDKSKFSSGAKATGKRQVA
ncbi:amino acid adenylation domain-containing protein [Pelagibius sp. Alg239-R121]|uniref:amino acid adenylation domain-containing protein n=1 Tax=Pelagibius sp. Alg239-R121 TaxID=2993448 RepID=UPI0024A6A09F|nr:amino acid adenylation domain-containing protein [Pelagibius sp. Alg239-R121]